MKEKEIMRCIVMLYRLRGEFDAIFDSIYVPSLVSGRITFLLNKVIKALESEVDV